VTQEVPLDKVTDRLSSFGELKLANKQQCPVRNDGILKCEVDEQWDSIHLNVEQLNSVNSINYEGIHGVFYFIWVPKWESLLTKKIVHIIFIIRYVYGSVITSSL